MPIELIVDAELVAAFAELTGDHSSIHVDPGFARRTQFRGPIVHGLLPVICLLGLDICVAGHTRSLRQLSCRFQQPARIGDVLLLSSQTRLEGAEEVVKFSVTKKEGGVILSSGSAVFASVLPPSDEALFDKERFFQAPIEELRWTAGELAQDQSDSLSFQPRFGAVQRMLACATSRMTGSTTQETPCEFRDGNLAAALVASTLVGMRLPGRFATFLELQASFRSEIRSGESIELTGQVTRISPSGNRIHLALQWLRKAECIGEGLAVSLVGEASPRGMACAEVRDHHRDLGLQGKVALVTGASRGIGEATAKLLAMRGARVVVHYFRGHDDAVQIVDDIQSCGGEAVALAADLRDEAAVTRLFEQINDAYGPVDILVNNAVGDFSPKPVEALTSDDFMEELNITLFGVHACCMKVLPHMKAGRRGKIINLGSIATEVPVASQNKYITAKSALVGYTRSLATELAACNVQVNMVVPAMTMTSLIAAIPAALRERLADENPVGTLLAPIDVAKTIAFLASDWSGPITGQQIVLNQGAAPFL